MPPDFSKKTVDTIAKRAGFRCSNPDCGAATVGPNSQSDKATTIGEAAHISGARPNAPRFDEAKTDTVRSAITNGIWLCRNCQKLIDADASRYSIELLLIWRERHEKKILRELGTETDRIQAELDSERIEQFSQYPAIIRRIAIDKPDGWEFTLTAELFRHLTKQDFQKLKDLESGMYNTIGEHVYDESALEWLNQRIREMSTMVAPAEKLLERLSNSWGMPGEPGNMDEIHHTCVLLQRWIHQIVEYEERVHATLVSDDYIECKSVVTGILALQALKLENIPETLEAMLEQAIKHSESNPNETLKLSHEVVFELPQNWDKRVRGVIKSLEKGMAPPLPDDNTTTFSSVLGWIALGTILFVFIF
ncbi:hypothetical protein K4L04_03930 [Phaeobacter inhibens]|uniref:hypothetical protein n=1 Tax=Phaeobacter inhibens TaxID=221822 RepID=UPI0021A5B40E|nr:hypothetical protein [Phaeobacter inhibens]UWR77118.1 hypothetical protein K4L04_03930 [Phaeobacter inhibens]